MGQSRTICIGVATFILIVCVAAAPTEEGKPTEKRKRQIFREQVLPHAGGKIPEDAFRADRLALNRLNKDGISVPDGVLLDARRHDKHPNVLRNSDLEMSVIKVVLSPDGRYVPPEGRYNDESTRTIDSTYIIRPPIGLYKHEFRRYPKHKIHSPIPAQLELPANTENPLSINQILTNFGFGTPGNYVFQSNPGFLMEYYHPYYTPQPFSNFDPFSFNDFNQDRLARQSDRKLVRFPSNDAESLKTRRLTPRPTVAASPLKGSPAHALPTYVPIEDLNDDCAGAQGQQEKMFADKKKKCQSFYICRKNGRRDSFVCPKGTLFNNALSRCDWWYNVRCR